MEVDYFEEHGIRFRYPADWEMEITEDGSLTTVSLQSPDGLAFTIVTVDETCPAPAEVADEALEAMREEYPTLDAVPALESIAGQNASGHDIEFISLDMTNSCAIRCLRTPRRTIFVFGQWSDLAAEENAAAFDDLKRSLQETDL